MLKFGLIAGYEQKRSYHNLYKSQFPGIDNNNGEIFLNNLNIPKLSEEQKQSCEGEISLEELKSISEAFKRTNHLVMTEYQLNFIKHAGT